MEISKHWSAPRRKDGKIVTQTGTIVDRSGDRIALVFEGETRHRWFRIANCSPVGEEFVSIDSGRLRREAAEANNLPSGVGGVIRHIGGKKFQVKECLYLDGARAAKAEKAEYVDGNWEILVRGPGIATSQVEGAKSTQKIERLWVIWQRLTPAPIEGWVDFRFSGEISRRGENFGMASHRQRHYKFLETHQYAKKVRISPPKAFSDERALERGWQRKLPAPYIPFSKGGAAWIPQNLEKIKHPIPPRGGRRKLRFPEWESPAFIETISVGGIPPAHEAEKLRAARAEQRMLSSKSYKPLPLTAGNRKEMAQTKDLCVINEENKVIMARRVKEK